MRFAILLAALLAAPAVARADTAALYFQGHGGAGGTDTQELMPGGASPGLGAALGITAGVRAFGFDVYLDRTGYDRGAVDRAAVGLRPSMSIGRARVYARGHAGVLAESDGALDPARAGTDRGGVFARGGAGLEGHVTRHVLLGVGLDAEYYALTPDGDSSTDTGFDVLAGVNLGFELSL